MARSYGLSGFALYRDVILPGALPSILVGVRFALGLMWVMLIVAETISAQSGIGYMTMNAREFLQTDVVVVGILLYALLGKLADMLAKGIERVTLRWHPAYRREGRSDERDSLRGERASPATISKHASCHEIARRDPVRGDRAIELRDVDKRYGERHVLSNFDCSIERGEFRVDRRTQRLREVDAAASDRGSGGGERRHARSPSARKTARCRPAIMFQDARLLPWKTVLQNVMLGLPQSSRDAARAVLAEVGLSERARRLARAAFRRPAAARRAGAGAGASAGPAAARRTARRARCAHAHRNAALIERLWREHRFTALLVTHDVQEAVALGDRIVLIEEGRITLDEPVRLPRPRARGSAAFAAIEEGCLRHCAASARTRNLPPKLCPLPFRSPDVRWAV